MYGAHDLALFSLTVLVLNATPGVDLVFTLMRTLQHGVRAGLAAALGINAGCVLHALAAAFGLAALLATSVAAFAVVKWAGALYLLWLAFGMLRHAWRPVVPTPAVADLGPATAQAPDAWRLFRQGLLTNALNPKVAIFFLALLPQFIDAGAADKTLAFLFLGAWFVAQSTLFLLLFVWLVAPLRRWQPGPGLRRTLDGASGLLFAVLAARLALTRSP